MPEREDMNQMENQGWAFRKGEVTCAKSRDVRGHGVFHEQGKFGDVQFQAADGEISQSQTVEGHMCTAK